MSRERAAIQLRMLRVEQAARNRARRAAVSTMAATEQELEDFELDTWTWQEHQLPPPADFTGNEFYLFGGRYSGKTWAGVRHFYEHMTGPPCSDDFEHGHQGVIVAPTLGDAVRSVFERPSGLQSVDPRCRITTRVGGTVAIFPNGAEAYVIGLPHKRAVESLRAAGNTCCAYMEEFATIPPLQAALDQLRLGVRVGPRPFIMGSSTPKPRPAVRKMVNDPKAFVRSGRLADNKHADEKTRQLMYDRFKGTSVEAQELDGVLLEQVEGALWGSDQLSERRVLTTDLPPRNDGETRQEWIIRTLGIVRLCLAIDPATSGKGDETGLVIVGATAGKRKTRQAFILEDGTELLKPSEWRAKARRMLERWGTNLVVAEDNRLGETVKLVVQDHIPNARVITVHAGISKGMRADPVAAVWDRQCWIVDTLPKLENQMTSWVPAEGDDPDTDFDASDPEGFRGSPDAIDGMVHGVRYVLGISSEPKGGSADLTGAFEAGWGG